MKKILFGFTFYFSFVWMNVSAQSQTQNTCYAYGHHKIACPSSNPDQKTVSINEKSEDKKVEKQDGSANTTQDKKKYNASEFKTKHYFFKSL